MADVTINDCDPLYDEKGKHIGYAGKDNTEWRAELFTKWMRPSKIAWFNTRGRRILNKHHMARLDAWVHKSTRVPSN